MTATDRELPPWRLLIRHPLFPAFALAGGLGIVVVSVPFWLPILYGSDVPETAFLAFLTYVSGIVGVCGAAVALATLWAATSVRHRAGRLACIAAVVGVATLVRVVVEVPLWSTSVGSLSEVMALESLRYVWECVVPVWMSALFLSVYAARRRPLSLATLIAVVATVALLLAATRAELERMSSFRVTVSDLRQLALESLYVVLFVVLLYWRRAWTDTMLLVAALGLRVVGYGLIWTWNMSWSPDSLVLGFVVGVARSIEVVVWYGVLRGAIEMRVVDWRLWYPTAVAADGGAAETSV